MLCKYRSVLPKTFFNPTVKLLEKALVAIHCSLATISQIKEHEDQPPFWFAAIDIDEVTVRFASSSRPNTVFGEGYFATINTRLEHTLIKGANLGLHDFVLSWLCDRYQCYDFTLDIGNGSWREEEPSQLAYHGPLA